MKYSLCIGLVLASLVVSACGTSGAGASQGSPPSSTAAATPAAAEATVTTQAITPPSASARSTLPPGFPLMARAAPVSLPADITVIARWLVPAVGSAAYDFYRQALPREGFSIVGAYPSERVALIRFRDPSGTIWQVQAEQSGDETQVTVQADRP